MQLFSGSVELYAYDASAVEMALKKKILTASIVCIQFYSFLYPIVSLGSNENPISKNSTYSRMFGWEVTVT